MKLTVHYKEGDDRYSVTIVNRTDYIRASRYLKVLKENSTHYGPSSTSQTAINAFEWLVDTFRICDGEGSRK